MPTLYRATQLHHEVLAWIAQRPTPFCVGEVPGAPRKKVYNVLDYLQREGRIERVARGVYAPVLSLAEEEPMAETLRAVIVAACGKYGPLDRASPTALRRCLTAILAAALAEQREEDREREQMRQLEREQRAS